MNRSDMKAALTEIYDDLLDQPDGVTWAAMADQFTADHPDARVTAGPELFDDLLKRVSIDIIRNHNIGNQGVLDYGDHGIFPASVTVPDGEGSFRRKQIKYATADELRLDADLHDVNVRAAISAQKRSKLAVDRLIPIMEEHGYETAGEALDHLTGGAS